MLLAVLYAGPASAGAAAPMAVQPDGKIVVAGGVIPGFGMLARLTPNGHLDPSFGDGGIAIDRNATPLTEVAIQPDGKIVALSSSARLTRYQADGSPDLSFGYNGTAAGRGAGGDSAHIALLPDGRIALASADVRIKIPPRQETHTYIFALDGRSAEPVSQVGIVGPLGALASLGDGSLLTAGYSSPSASPHEESQGFLARIVPGTGLPYDPAFGDGGLVTISYSGSLPFFYALLPTADGLYAAGSGDSHVILARFSNEGVLDGGFGSGGFTSVSPGPGSSWATDLAVQADGKVAVAGAVSTKTGQDGPYCDSCVRPLLLRFLPGGTLDPAFGEGGTVLLTEPDGSALPGIGQAVASLADGRTLFLGRPRGGKPGRIVVARVEQSGALDRGFGDEGLATVEACAGNAAIQRRDGCLPSVRARLRVRRVSREGVALRLRIRPSSSWAHITGFELTLPRQVETIEGRGRRIRATLIEAGSPQRLVRVAMTRRELSGFFRNKAPRSILLEIPAGVLRRAKAVPAGRELPFRLAVSFRAGSFGYDEAGTHVVVLRRALG